MKNNKGIASIVVIVIVLIVLIIVICCCCGGISSCFGENSSSNSSNNLVTNDNSNLTEEDNTIIYDNDEEQKKEIEETEIEKQGEAETGVLTENDEEYNSKPELEQGPESEPQPKPELEPQPEPELEPQPEPEPEPQPEPEPEPQPEPEPEPQPEPEPEPELREYELKKSGDEKVKEFFELMKNEKLTMDEIFLNARKNGLYVNKVESVEDSNYRYCDISAVSGEIREYNEYRDYSGNYYIELQYFRNKPNYNGFLRNGNGGSEGFIDMF